MGDFCTPRPRPGQPDPPVEQRQEADEFADAVKQLAPLLPPRNEDEQRQDDADEVPTH